MTLACPLVSLIRTTSICLALGFSAGTFAHGGEEHAATTTTASDSIAVNHVVIEAGKRISGPVVVKVKQGEEVSISFLSDQDDELHFHGYDITVKIKAGQFAMLSFKARYAGRFSYELHHADNEIGAVEVYPK